MKVFQWHAVLPVSQTVQKNPKVEECEQDEERALRAKPKEAAQGHESPWGSL